MWSAAEVAMPPVEVLAAVVRFQPEVSKIGMHMEMRSQRLASCHFSEVAVDGLVVDIGY
jgi:hypothetical protein